MQSARKSLAPSTAEAPDTNKKTRKKLKSNGSPDTPASSSPTVTKQQATTTNDSLSSPISNGAPSTDSTMSSPPKTKRKSSQPPISPPAPTPNGAAETVASTPALSKKTENGIEAPQSISSAPLSNKKKSVPASPKIQPLSTPASSTSVQGFSSRGVVVQRCRFLACQPSAVTCLAFNATGSLVAVGRESGDVEIWNVLFGWFCERVLGGSADFPVRNVHWVADEEGERLLSTGEKGIIEWDLPRLRHKLTSSSYGGAVHGSCIRDSTEKKDDASLALACEDGSVRVFALNDSVQYVRALQKHEAKALSVSWVGDMIVSGGADGLIMVWECATWAQTTVIFVQAAGPKEPTSVWQVKIIPRDMSIVSGDSLGRVQIWESKFGTLLQSFSQHQADVLALTLSNGGRTLYASGVDTQMTVFNSVPYEHTGQEKWVLSSSHRSHTHDVTALAAFDPPGASRPAPQLAPFVPLPRFSHASSSSSDPSLDKSSTSTPAVTTAVNTTNTNTTVTTTTTTNTHTITKTNSSLATQGELENLVINDETANMGQSVVISGSHDCQIAVFSVNLRNHPTKILPFRPVVSMSSPPSPPLSFSASSSSSTTTALSCTSSASSSSSTSTSSPSSPVYLLIRHKMQLQLWRTGSFLSGETPNVSSPQEYLLRIDTAERGRAWNLIASSISPDGQWVVASSAHSLKLYRYSVQSNSVRYVEESKALPPSSCLCFTPDSRTLICGGLDQMVSVVSLESCTVQARLPLPAKDKLSDAGCVVALSVTSDSQSLAVADHLHSLSVFDLKHLKHQCTLPSLGQSTLAMAFQPESTTLVVVTAKNEVFAFDTIKNELTDWSRQNSLKLPRALTHASERVFGISFNPTKPTHALLVAGNFLCSVDFTRPAPKPTTSVARVGERESKCDTQNFNMIRRFSPILAAELCPSGLVVIEVPWFKLMQGFPPAFKRQKYGT